MRGTFPEPVLALPDLETWSREAPSLAVLGHPIRHSISPAMHHAALAALARDDGRFADWRYFRFDVPPADLPRALERLHACRFHGLNLTIPHKVIACGCTAAIDADARQAGAVNTLRWAQEGWHGFNTDGYGLTRGVREDLGRDIAGSSVVLLGAGGAARGAAVECLARGCAELWLVNRTKVNLDRLLEILGPIAGKIPVRGWDRSRAPAGPKAGFILVNATSAGLRPGDPPPIDLAALPRPAGVLDMNYNPPRTALLRQAESLGIPCANGLSMLVNQGAKALEIWTGIPADRTAPIMMAAAREALAGGGPSD